MEDKHIQEFKNTFGILFKLFFLFIAFSWFFRTTFIIYYFDKFQNIDNLFYNLVLSYWHSIPLDMATASFFIIIPWLLLFLNSLIFRFNFMKYLIGFYSYVMLALSSFIYIAEFGVYGEWEEKPTFEIFTYLKHPEEIIDSNPVWASVILTILLVVVLVSIYKLNKKIFESYDLKSKRSFSVIIAFFFLSPFIFLGVRGGWMEIPISKSDPVFSHHKVLNDLATNSVYYFYASIQENQDILSGKNPYKVDMPQAKKDEILKEFMATPDGCKTTKLLTTNRPNIVLVALESVAGDFLDTPKYRKLIPNILDISSHGILFTKAYAAGTLSHEGLPSIFSGWPAMYNIYITNLPNKMKKLPSLTQELAKVGYDSMFMFGGRLRYGNLTSYMYKNGFRIIQEERDIHLKQKSTLGYPDGEMFPYLVKETTKKLKQPFISAMFTLSSHSPYDQPMKDVVEWGGRDKGYLNSIVYTDKSIGEFIKEAKKQPWFKNTLFIFSSDHSHHTPYGWSRNNPKWHHIVMFMYGDVIKKKYRGMRVDKVVGQQDISATILAQLGLSHKAFEWSRDVFCKSYKPSNYFMLQNGAGIVEQNGSIAYNFKDNRVLYKDGNVSGLKLKANLYIEKLLQTFLDY